MPSRHRILITGSSGYLGQHVLHFLLTKFSDKDTNQHPLHITACYGDLPSFPSYCDTLLTSLASSQSCQIELELIDKSTFDLSIPSTITTFFHNRPPYDVILHLAALSNVRTSETYPQRAYTINAPQTMLDALCHTSNRPSHPIVFIFLSTDQVYDGNAHNALYDEHTHPRPINTYGHTKLQFEQSLRNCDPSILQPIILRSSLILGGTAPIGPCSKQSFVQFIQDRLEHKIETEFYTNELRNAVFVEDVVKVLYFWIHGVIVGSSEAVPKNLCVYNMGGVDNVSRYDMALAVTQRWDMEGQCMKPVEREKRKNNPLDLSMDSQKLERTIRWKFMGLKDMLQCII